MLLSLLAKMAVVVIWGLGGSVQKNATILVDKQIQNDGTIVTVSIYPESVELEQGETVQFTSFAYDQYNQQVEFTPIWMTTGGEITQDGLYKATVAGAYEVLVTDAHTGVYSVAKVHISCHQTSDACLVIEPSRVELTKGEMIQFLAYGRAESGELTLVPIMWESGGGWIDENGVYTASEVGDFLITATQFGSSKYGTAHISVKSISILPPWMYQESGKVWFSLIGILIGLSLGMGYYLYRHNPYKPGQETS